jgi:hypothetical protein
VIVNRTQTPLIKDGHFVDFKCLLDITLGDDIVSQLGQFVKDLLSGRGLRNAASLGFGLLVSGHSNMGLDHPSPYDGQCHVQGAANVSTNDWLLALPVGHILQKWLNRLGSRRRTTSHRRSAPDQ